MEGRGEKDVKYCPLSFPNEQALEKCSSVCKWYDEETGECRAIQIGEWMCRILAEHLSQIGGWLDSILEKIGEAVKNDRGIYGMMVKIVGEEERRRRAETERAISEEKVKKEMVEEMDVIERKAEERRAKRAMGILKDDCDAVEKQARLMGLKELRTWEFSNLGREKTERIYYFEPDGVRTVIRTPGGEEEEVRFPTLFDAVASMPWPVGETASLRAEVWKIRREIADGG